MASVKITLSRNTSKNRPAGFLRSENRGSNTRCLIWILGGALYVAIGLTTALGAEVSDLVINSSLGHLLLSARVRDAVSGGVTNSPDADVSATLIFSIALYEVRPFWFNKIIAHHTATNTIKRHPEKNAYRLLRSWDSGPPLRVDELNQARRLIVQISNLKVIPLAGLEKGRTYQIRVRVVCQDKKAFLFSPAGGFKTDWHTVDFTY